jgi:hypothetical protein
LPEVWAADGKRAAMAGREIFSRDVHGAKLQELSQHSGNEREQEMTFTQEMQALDSLYDYLAAKYTTRIAARATEAMARYNVSCADALEEAQDNEARQDEKANHETAY